MKQMKKTVLLLLIFGGFMFTFPTVTAQSIFVKNNYYLKVKSGTKLDISKNLTIETGSTLDLHGKLTVDGSLTSPNANNLVIYSDATGDGSLIFGSGTPHATIYRYVGNTDWHQVSIPLSGGTTCQDFYFDNSPNTWLARYNENDNSWTYITELTEPLYYGEGFDFKLESATATVDFAGGISAGNFILNSGSSPSLEFTDASHGFNLVGNPYSSAIDFDNDGVNNWTMTNMEQSIWMLDESDDTGNYRNCTTAGGGSLTDGIIPMGQAIFVRATADSPVLTIPAARRTHNDQGFYKSANAGKEFSEGYESYMKIRADKNGAWDEIWVSFGANGTEGFDNGYGCTKMMGGDDSPQLYLREENIENFLSIDHLPVILENIERIVNMSFIPGIQGEQKFEADLSRLVDSTTVILEDIPEGIFTNLNDQNTYVFNSSKSDNPDRFRLHFYNITGLDENEEAPNTGLHIYSDTKHIYIKNDEIAGYHNKVEVFIYDILGKQIYRQSIAAQPLTKIKVNVSNSYVIVKAINDNKIATAKVYIK